MSWPSERPGWYRDEFSHQGKRYQFHQPHDTKRAADIAVTKWKAKILSGEPPKKRGGITVADVIDIGLEESKDRNRVRTYTTRRSQAKAIKRHLGSIPAAHLTGQHLREKYKKARLREGAQGPGINREVSFLGRCWRIATISGDLGHPAPDNPQQLWEPLEETPFDPYIVSPEEREVLLSAARGASYPDRFHAFIALGVCHGLRWSEALTLHWDRVSLTEGVIRLQAQACKGKKPRLIIMDDYSKAALREIGPGVGPIFGCHPGRPTCKYRRPWRRLLEETGFAHLSKRLFHDLRHTHATEVTGERDLYAAQLILGHADQRTTQRYVHLSEEAVKRITSRKPGTMFHVEHNRTTA